MMEKMIETTRIENIRVYRMGASPPISMSLLQEVLTGA